MRKTWLAPLFAAFTAAGLAFATPATAQTTLKMAYALSASSHYGAGGEAFSLQQVEDERDGLAGKIIGGGDGGRFRILGMEVQVDEDHRDVGGDAPLLAADHQLLVDAPPEGEHAGGGQARRRGAFPAEGEEIRMMCRLGHGALPDLFEMG